MPGANRGRLRAQKLGLRRRMQALAEQRRCPKCQRKSAARTIRVDPWTTVKVCRYCGEL